MISFTLGSLINVLKESLLNTVASRRVLDFAVDRMNIIFKELSLCLLFNFIPIL